MNGEKARKLASLTVLKVRPLSLDSIRVLRFYGFKISLLVIILRPNNNTDLGLFLGSLCN